MADSIPSLRKLVNELRAEVRELKSRPAEIVEKVVTREVPVEVVREVRVPVVEYVDRVVDRPIIQYVDRIIEVVKEVKIPIIEYIDRTVEVKVDRPVIEYVDRFVDRPIIQYIETPVEVVKEVPIVKTVTEYIDRVIEKPVAIYVDRIEYRDVIKELPAPPPEVITKIVEVEVPVEVIRVVPVHIDRPVYQDNPDHVETIRKLQEKLCQFTSQSDS